jgi:hypothetical protein
MITEMARVRGAAAGDQVDDEGGDAEGGRRGQAGWS